MGIVVSGIRLPIESSEREAVAAAVKRIGAHHVADAKVCKKAVDARRREIAFVYSVHLVCTVDEAALAASFCDASIQYKPQETFNPAHCDSPPAYPPVICGFGPAGLFCALVLARCGFNPIVLERGADVEKRQKQVEQFWETGKLCPNSNVQFGEGGAGTFSDGKLTTRIGDPLCAFVLQTFFEHGAPQEICYLAKPHIGTDRLRGIIQSIREEIKQLGGQIFFEHKVEDITLSAKGVCGVKISGGERVETDTIVLAIGHSARDTYEMLAQKEVLMEAKPFSMGVRIEHLQRDIDRATYGEYAGHKNLSPAEYQLSYRQNGEACYTFCMCPGGKVIAAASEEGGVVTNGMSLYARDGENANSAVVVSVNPQNLFGSDPLAGVWLQRELEKKAYIAGGGYTAPVQTVGAFLKGESNRLTKVAPSYTGGYTLCDVGGLFPGAIRNMLQTGLRSFGKKINGFDEGSAVLTGVESRTSAPVRILRGQDYKAVGINGLYPCGEGAGYAGGIMSAAVDGIHVALAIMEEAKGK